MCGTVGAELLLLLPNYCRSGNRHVCVVVSVELLWWWSYCRRGAMHACVVVGVELLLSLIYCRRGTMHACVGSCRCGTDVAVELLLP